MGAITKEFAQDIIKGHGYGVAPSAVEELARIALSSLEAEPVADVVAWSSPNEERTCDIRLRRHDITAGPLYTAPPAPVSVPDLLEQFAEFMAAESIKSGDYPDGWQSKASNAAHEYAQNIRAAILQGAEPVSQRYKLPEVIDENLVEGLRLLQCMLDDYRERNYGHAHEWIRHIDRKFAEHSESHEDDAYSIFSSLLQGAAAG